MYLSISVFLTFVNCILSDITSVFTPSSEEAAVLLWDLRCPSTPVSKLTPTVVKPDQKLGATGAIFYQSMCSKIESDPLSSSSALVVGYESGAVISFDLRQGRCTPLQRYNILRFLSWSFIIESCVVSKKLSILC